MQEIWKTLGRILLYLTLILIMVSSVGTAVMKRPFLLAPIRSNSMYPLFVRGDMVSCLMAAAAYSSAVIQNEADLTVYNTGDSLLALRPTTGSPGLLDGTAYIDEDGELKFLFQKGLAGSHGLQPNSVYTWEKLFHAYNQSNSNVRVTVKVKEEIKGFVKVGTDTDEGWGSGWGNSVTFDLPSGWSKNVDIKVVVPSGTALGSLDGAIEVSAEALN